MHQISQNSQSTYRNYKAAPITFSAAVVIDYALTFCISMINSTTGTHATNI